MCSPQNIHSWQYIEYTDDVMQLPEHDFPRLYLILPGDSTMRTSDRREGNMDCNARSRRATYGNRPFLLFFAQATDFISRTSNPLLDLRGTRLDNECVG